MGISGRGDRDWRNASDGSEAGGESIVIAYELKPVGGELYCDQVETTGLRYFSKDEKPELFTKSHDNLWDEIWK